MQAIILAAGMGKRLGNLTSNNTKCMVEVNGVTLIKRMLSQLDSLTPALSRIILVIGYKGEELKDYVETLGIDTRIEFHWNREYATTNNILSLALVKDQLVEEDTLLLESDVIFEDAVLEELVQDERPTLALVDKYESWMDGTMVKIDSHDNILSFVPGKRIVYDEIADYYKTVNIYKFSKSFSETQYVPFLEAYSKAYGNNEYYEQVLRVLIVMDDSEVKAKRLHGQLWYEIDDILDLDIASSMFNVGPKDYFDKIQARYGGYWRYPKLLDFCYLVNPYYPPQRLFDEIAVSLNRLITSYPSGAEVNSLLAAQNFSIEKDLVIVGNGATELIASLLRFIDTPIGMIKPTFEEYPNRCDIKDTVVFTPETDGFSYTASDVMEHFADKGIGSLILINPDNPSGNYLCKDEIHTLLEWARSRSIRFILDESFADFSDEPDNSCLVNDLLRSYENLVVIKSISKSFGVPGLRLGIMATSDSVLLSAVKKDMAIWNINSLGELYLQIAGKYRGDYSRALDRLRKERQRFSELLSSIKGIRVFPSQANYVMVELSGGMDAETLSERLLKEKDILIKDLSKKVGPDRQFIRLAVRTSDDNDMLIAALKSILG